MAIIDCNFELKQHVVIAASGKTGEVTALYVSRTGVKSYYIKYVNAGGGVCGRYFEEDQLAAARQEGEAQK